MSCLSAVSLAKRPRDVGQWMFRSYNRVVNGSSGGRGMYRIGCSDGAIHAGYRASGSWYM